MTAAPSTAAASPWRRGILHPTGAEPHTFLGRGRGSILRHSPLLTLSHQACHLHRGMAESDRGLP